MIKEFTYEPYKGVHVEPSTSSYGRWMIKLSEVTFKFFWKKADADTFAAGVNKAAHLREIGSD